MVFRCHYYGFAFMNWRCLVRIWRQTFGPCRPSLASREDCNEVPSFFFFRVFDSCLTRSCAQRVTMYIVGYMFLCACVRTCVCTGARVCAHGHFWTSLHITKRWEDAMPSVHDNIQSCFYKRCSKTLPFWFKQSWVLFWKLRTVFNTPLYTHKKCKSDRAPFTWYILGNINAGSTGTFSLITRKVLNNKKYYYSVLKSFRGKLQGYAMKNRGLRAKNLKTFVLILTRSPKVKPIVLSYVSLDVT